MLSAPGRKEERNGGPITYPQNLKTVNTVPQVIRRYCKSTAPCSLLLRR